MRIWLNFKTDAMGRTDIVGAGRHKPGIYAMMTQVALAGDCLLIVEGYRVIGACLYTNLTARALRLIQNHDSVGSFADCIRRAGIGTRRIIAVPAYIYLVDKIEFARNHPGAVFPHPDQLNSVAWAVFLFTGHLTGLASPAQLISKRQYDSPHEDSPSFAFGIYFAQKRAHAGCTHGRITGFIGIVG
jgi:hypothetical protein